MTAAWVWLLAGVALAQEPTPAEPSAPEEDDDTPIFVDRRAPEEIVVMPLDAAREAVIQAAGEQGYVRRIRRKDHTILRHDDPWKGQLLLFDDGRVTVKRQPVRFEPPGGASNPANYAWCVLLPVCIRTSGQTAAPRLFRSHERKVLAAVADEVQVLRERIADHALDGKLARLPGQLARLWHHGEPLEPGPPLATFAERRRAIFAFWDSRTETDWGEQVRDAVEAYVRAEVQPGEHPFSPDEVAALNARRTVRRAFLAPRAVE